jgi:hypothetical protein
MEKGRDICFNFNQICRFCLSQGGVMSAIFADSGQGMTSLPTKIMSCVSVQVSGDYVSIQQSEARGASQGLFGAEAWLLFRVIRLVI